MWLGAHTKRSKLCTFLTKNCSVLAERRVTASVSPGPTLRAGRCDNLPGLHALFLASKAHSTRCLRSPSAQR